jgi:Protein of unknown function (DUF2934)
MLRRPPEINIIRKAYELWELSGKPEGRDQEFYLQALQRLQRALENVSLGPPAESPGSSRATLRDD